MFKKYLTKSLVCVIIYAVLFFVIDINVVEASIPVNKKVVAIDAGHGQWDPGKTRGNVEEKHINLQVAEKLQTLLEMGGTIVFVTRADDMALAEKKREDLRARANLANSAGADIFISIHQNSYESPKVNGAQAFYHESSEKSKILAEKIQTHITGFLDTSNKREAKASDTYYVLKNTDMPAVIVECGFMSNEKELEMLLNDEYQDKVAWAIYMGIVDYFAEIKD